MATMNVSLTDELKAWVEEQVASGRYGNASEYVRELIRGQQDRDQRLAFQQRVIDEALASGVSERSPAEIRAAVLKRWRAEQKTAAE